MKEIIKFLPLVLALIGGVLSAISLGISAGNKKRLDDYHRKRGDIERYQ